MLPRRTAPAVQSRPVKPAPFLYLRPDSLDETLDLLREHGGDAKILAGGQSLVPMMNLRLAQPRALIDIARLDALAGVRANGELTIGATTRQSAALGDPGLREKTPLLAEALGWIGHEANRNRGTVGGSVAHADPASELPAALLALDATMVAHGPTGEREIAADDFFEFFLTTALEPAEILTEIRIPKSSFETGSSAWGFAEIARRRGDFALVGAAFHAVCDTGGSIATCRLALFGVAGRAVRATAAEDLLVGERLENAEVVAAAAAAVGSSLDAASDQHASAQYREDVAPVLARRVVEQAAQRRGAERGR